MPAPTDPEKVAAILAAIDGERSARSIADEFGVSASTVSKIARDHGVVAAFARARTERATRAKTIDMAADRARLKARLLEEGHRFLDRLHQPHTAFSFGGKENTYNEKTFPEPPVEAARNLMTSAAIAIDKHVVLDRHDNDGGQAAALSMMGRIAGAIEAVAGLDGGDGYVDPNGVTPEDAVSGPAGPGEG